MLFLIHRLPNDRDARTIETPSSAVIQPLCRSSILGYLTKAGSDEAAGPPSAILETNYRPQELRRKRDVEPRSENDVGPQSIRTQPPIEQRISDRDKIEPDQVDQRGCTGVTQRLKGVVQQHQRAQHPRQCRNQHRRERSWACSPNVRQQDGSFTSPGLFPAQLLPEELSVPLRNISPGFGFTVKTRNPAATQKGVSQGSVIPISTCDAEEALVLPTFEQWFYCAAAIRSEAARTADYGPQHRLSGLQQLERHVIAGRLHCSQQVRPGVPGVGQPRDCPNLTVREPADQLAKGALGWRGV